MLKKKNGTNGGLFVGEYVPVKGMGAGPEIKREADENSGK